MMARMQIQIALGAGDITAVLPDRALVIPLDQTLSPRNEDPGPKLRQGFDRLEAALRDEYGDDRLEGGIRLQVALIPPLSDARLVELPPLRPREFDAVLRRIAPCHFLGGARDMVMGGERFGKGESGRPAPVFAAAAGRSLVGAVHQAVESKGWQIERIVPAQAAWLHALREAAPLPVTSRSGQDLELTRLMVAFEEGVIYLIRMVGEQPNQLRRIAYRNLSEVAAKAGPMPGQALVLAEGEVRASLVCGLADAGWELISPKEARSASFEAAHHATDALPELVSPSLTLARSRRDRRRTRTMLAAAVLMLVAAAAVHLWGMDRSLGTVQAERAALRELFAPALALRDSLDRMIERTESLQAVERETTRWTAFLVELSILLPQETHLVSLRGAGGRVILEAVGDRAGEALSALREASTFRDARIEGVIRRDLEGGATSREHFTLSMVLVKGGER